MDPSKKNVQPEPPSPTLDYQRAAPGMHGPAVWAVVALWVMGAIYAVLFVVALVVCADASISSHIVEPAFVGMFLLAWFGGTSQSYCRAAYDIHKGRWDAVERAMRTTAVNLVPAMLMGVGGLATGVSALFEFRRLPWPEAVGFLLMGLFPMMSLLTLLFILQHLRNTWRAMPQAPSEHPPDPQNP